MFSVTSRLAVFALALVFSAGLQAATPNLVVYTYDSFI